MEEEDDWGKVVQRLELDEVEDVVARAVELHDERVRGNG